MQAGGACVGQSTALGCSRITHGSFTSKRTQCATHRRLTSRVTAATTSPDKVVPIPAAPEQMVAQAVQAVEAAYQDGIRLQRLQLLLPLIGATDLDDWPGGIRQQFKAAQPLLESILRQLKQKPRLIGGLAGEIWDQGDAVGAWYGQKLGGILFPTASTLSKVRDMAEGSSHASEVLMIVNPQWELRGNLMNDFGFGQRRIQLEAFVNSFQDTYFFKQLRVYGDDVRVLRCYPGPWQIHVVDKSGKGELLKTQETAPEYKEIEEALRNKPDSNMNKTWVQRLQEEYYFNQDSLRR